MAGRAYLMHESEIAAVKAHVAPPNFDGGFFRKREVVTGSECDLFFACQMRKLDGSCWCWQARRGTCKAVIPDEQP